MLFWMGTSSKWAIPILPNHIHKLGSSLALFVLSYDISLTMFSSFFSFIHFMYIFEI